MIMYVNTANKSCFVGCKALVLGVHDNCMDIGCYFDNCLLIFMKFIEIYN